MGKEPQTDDWAEYSGKAEAARIIDKEGKHDTAPGAPAAVRAVDSVLARLSYPPRKDGASLTTPVPAYIRKELERIVADAYADQDEAARAVLAICKGAMDPDILCQTATMLSRDYPHTADWLWDTAKELRPLVDRLEATMGAKDKVQP